MAELKKRPLFNPEGDTEVVDRRMIGGNTTNHTTSATTKQMPMIIMSNRPSSAIESDAMKMPGVTTRHAKMKTIQIASLIRHTFFTRGSS